MRRLLACLCLVALLLLSAVPSGSVLLFAVLVPLALLVISLVCGRLPRLESDLCTQLIEYLSISRPRGPPLN